MSVICINATEREWENTLCCNLGELSLKDYFFKDGIKRNNSKVTQITLTNTIRLIKALATTLLFIRRINTANVAKIQGASKPVHPPL